MGGAGVEVEDAAAPADTSHNAPSAETCPCTARSHSDPDGSSMAAGRVHTQRWSLWMECVYDPLAAAEAAAPMGGHRCPLPTPPVSGSTVVVPPPRSTQPKGRSAGEKPGQASFPPLRQ